MLATNHQNMTEIQDGERLLTSSSDSEEFGQVLDDLDSKKYCAEDVSFTLQLHRRRPNAHGGLHSRPNRALQPNSNKYQKYANRFRSTPFEEWEVRSSIGMSNSVTTSIRDSVRDTAIGRTRRTDKADRATVDKAIDPKTFLVILTILNRGDFDYVYGCFSTGKEANIYHATNSDGQELAVKVYKTSVLGIKNRDCYIQGDRRFSRGYSKGSTRKMIKTWAEKEERNLKRLRKRGIRCPYPIVLKENVLAMEFIGKAGWPAPQLRDAALSLDKLRECYVEIIMAMRTLYQKCKLVHGDLSEYNILYFEGHLYIIDVSQAVDLDHPLALDFFRRDCINVSVSISLSGLIACSQLFFPLNSYLEILSKRLELSPLPHVLCRLFVCEARNLFSVFSRVQVFFRKNGVAVMTIRELFDFIVDPSIDDDSVDGYLEEVHQKILARGDVISAEEEIADLVFAQSFIPRTLEEVKNAEEDVQCIVSGNDTRDMYYQTITGLHKALYPAVASVNKINSASLPDLHSDDCEYDTSSSDDEGSSEGEHSPLDRKEARKVNKRIVKEEKREARKSKIPKAVKKKRRKLAKAKKNR